MRNILVERQVHKLYHFTQANNLKNIFKYGLLSRCELESRGIDCFINDEYRYDECLEAICTSIEFPNYKMFYKLRCDNPDIDWVVLELDANIICDVKCAFNWTNAGDSKSYSIPLNQRMTKSALEDLFNDKDGYPSREDLRIPDCYPTNPQAEVLIFDIIPIDYINSVNFIDEDTLLRYKEIVPHSIDAIIDDELFRWRNDYEYWVGRAND